MKVSVYVVALATLLSSPLRICAAPPFPIELPSTSSRDQQGALRYIWEEIQQNTLWKALPDRYSSVQPAWTEFLHTQAWPIIESYYSETFPHKRQFLRLIRPDEEASFYGSSTSTVWREHRKTVAERLVTAFAEKQLAEERREWGQTLSLELGSRAQVPDTGEKSG